MRSPGLGRRWHLSRGTRNPSFPTPAFWYWNPSSSPRIVSCCQSASSRSPRVRNAAGHPSLSTAATCDGYRIYRGRGFPFRFTSEFGASVAETATVRAKCSPSAWRESRLIFGIPADCLRLCVRWDMWPWSHLRSRRCDLLSLIIVGQTETLVCTRIPNRSVNPSRKEEPGDSSASAFLLAARTYRNHLRWKTSGESYRVL